MPRGNPEHQAFIKEWSAANKGKYKRDEYFKAMATAWGERKAAKGSAAAPATDASRTETPAVASGMPY